MYQRRVAYLGLRGNQLIRSEASIQGRNGPDHASWPQEPNGVEVQRPARHHRIVQTGSGL